MFSIVAIVQLPKFHRKTQLFSTDSWTGEDESVSTCGEVLLMSVFHDSSFHNLLEVSKELVICSSPIHIVDCEIWGSIWSFSEVLNRFDGWLFSFTFSEKISLKFVVSPCSSFTVPQKSILKLFSSLIGGLLVSPASGVWVMKFSESVIFLIIKHIKYISFF